MFIISERILKRVPRQIEVTQGTITLAKYFAELSHMLRSNSVVAQVEADQFIRTGDVLFQVGNACGIDRCFH